MNQVKRVHRGKPEPFLNLIRNLSGLSDQDAGLVIRMGGAYLGKFRCKDPQKKVRDGEMISAWFRLPLTMEPVTFDPNWIIHDSKQILIAAKPKGLPTQGRRDADYMAFYELLKAQVKGYVGLHHRLDQDTSGLLLFARDRFVNKDIAALFADRLVEKTYLAIAKGEWIHGDQDWEITDPIVSHMTPKGTRHKVAANGKSAHTSVRCITQVDDLLLLSVKPRTGRTHQIRVHLSHHGLPLWGDQWYDGAQHPEGFLLHCARLQWSAQGKLPRGDWSIKPPVQWRDRLPQALADQLDQSGGATC